MLLVGSIPAVYAQISQGGLPLPEQLTVSRKLKSSSVSSSLQTPFIEMPSFDKEELLHEDSLPGNRVGGIRFAYKFNVSIAPDNTGVSTVLDDGTKVWRVGIRSKDAFSLNILFTEFLLPPDAKVFIYSPDRGNILGAFTEANNQPSGLLPVAPIEGDEIIVEYSEPANALFEGKLKIGEVNHDYRGLRDLPAFQKSESCEVNATCDDVHPQQRRSACLIIVDGTISCSGNLVNNTTQDGTPYLLSAAHCLYNSRNQLILSKAETSVFFFNYETPYCFSDIQGSMEMSVAGATVQASDRERDLLLLRLKETPPVDYRTYYAGWNASGDVAGPVYCFHHPGGDIKKISTDNNTPYPASFIVEGNIFLSNSHWRVNRWGQGITEGGSSGSGLFDAGDRIIGNLSGGSSICTNPGSDYFYRLNVVWNGNAASDISKNLKPWLDPANADTLLLDGRESDENPCIRLSNWQEGEELDGHSSSNGYAAGHNSMGITEFAERFACSERSALYGIYFLPQKGRYSASSPVTAQIYSGNTAPENLLYQQTVKISNTEYLSRSGFSETNLSYFLRKENYLRFPEPVAVDTSFFVVFKILPIPTVPADTFALYYTAGRDQGDLNTAWFKEGSVWKPFSENPLYPHPASLMVDAVVRLSDSNSVSQLYATRAKTEIFPNPVKNELTVRFIENKYPVQLRLSDLSGRILFVENNLQESSSYALQTNLLCEKGIFFLHVIYSDRTDVLKFIKL
jgi:hypothetical protein